MNIGYFGGTFDPPHIGHQILAAEAMFQLKLDAIKWILTPNPPHKRNQEITSIDHRIDMLQAVFDDYPQFSLSRIDLDRDPPHYAADTVKLIKMKDSSSMLIYIIGEDSLRDLPNWYEPNEFLKNIDLLCVAKRPNIRADLAELDGILPGLEKKTVFLTGFILEISSSIIRNRIKQKAPFKHLVAPAVSKYIEKNNLY